jgi:transcriptional regulator with XRE-family HTH domain
MNKIRKKGEVLEFLESLIEDSPENRLVERQELFRIALSQAMKNIRNKVGVSQNEIAEKLGVTQSWISRLESANHDHTFESVMGYLSALDADLETSFFLNGEKITTVGVKLGITPQESEVFLEKVLETLEQSSAESSNEQEESLTKPMRFPFLASETEAATEEATNIICSQHSLWGGCAA